MVNRIYLAKFTPPEVGLQKDQSGEKVSGVFLLNAPFAFPTSPRSTVPPRMSPYVPPTEQFVTEIPVADAERSMRFYVELGFTLLRREKSGR